MKRDTTNYTIYLPILLLVVVLVHISPSIGVHSGQDPFSMNTFVQGASFIYSLGL